MENRTKNIILIISIAIILVIIVSGGILCISNLFGKKDSNKEDVYNKELYISAKLPNISGNENSILDEFGKRTNISQELKEEKRWMNLQFTDFSVYSMNSNKSAILFTINNNSNMIIETGKFQLQLKDNSDKIVSIVNFDEVILPSSGKIKVTVDVDGDITNLKNIVVDDINYEMNLQEVEK